MFLFSSHALLQNIVYTLIMSIIHGVILPSFSYLTIIFLFTYSVPVRLNGANFDYGGRVEVFYGGKWGKICRNEWGFDDVKVVCTQLGFAGAIAEFITSEIKDENLPYLMSNVSCNGKEFNLSSCKRTDRENYCPDNKGAQALCEPSKFITSRETYQIKTVQCSVLDARMVILTNIYIPG